MYKTMRNWFQQLHRSKLLTRLVDSSKAAKSMDMGRVVGKKKFHRSTSRALEGQVREPFGREKAPKYQCMVKGKMARKVAHKEEEVARTVARKVEL